MRKIFVCNLDYFATAVNAEVLYFMKYCKVNEKYVLHIFV